MGMVPKLFLLIILIKTTTSYRDYPASRMPDYNLDYDLKDSRTHLDYSTHNVQHTGDDEDYKYDDEGDNTNPRKEFNDNATPNKPKRLLPIREYIDTDLYHEEELKLQGRRRKTIRYKNTEIDSEHSNHDIDNDEDIDYSLKRVDVKGSDDKISKRYNSREFVENKPRRKPRDRPIKIILPNHEQLNDEKNVRQKIRKDTLQLRSPNKDDISKNILIEAFDDMKRVNNFKENLPLIIRQPVNMTEFASPSDSEILPYRRADKIEDTTRISLQVSHTTLSLPYNMTLKMEVVNQSEVSLAERSRLSILKKVLKKESANVTKTTKPPVLMQVTNNMQTVVLVESNNLENEIKKIRRVMDDNPEVIEKAKNLMRQKLVANARSIEDLTDNWDEMICDYIDLNLLNAATSSANICLILYYVNSIALVMFEI